MGEDGYKNYVVEKGQKVEGATGAANTDYTVKNLIGDNTITVVAKGNGSLSLVSTDFTGYTWTTVSAGTYYFSKGAAESFGESKATTLQYKDDDPTTYRFKDFWGIGKHVTFSVTDDTTSEYGDGGKVIIVPAQTTPFTLGSNGALFMADAITNKLANMPSAILPMVRSISLWYIMLKQVLSLQVLKNLFQAPSNKLYNKGVSLLLNTMGKGIHLFLFIYLLQLKHLSKKKRGQ